MKAFPSIVTAAFLVLLTATENNAAHGWMNRQHHHHCYSSRMVASSSRCSYTTRVLRLHPDQAQELADCAHDFMKLAMEEKAIEQQKQKLLSRDISKRLKMESDRDCLVTNNGEEEVYSGGNGPVSWARKRLPWPFRPGTGAVVNAAANKLP
jgi:hypothetical protein